MDDSARPRSVRCTYYATPRRRVDKLTPRRDRRHLRAGLRVLRCAVTVPMQTKIASAVAAAAGVSPRSVSLSMHPASAGVILRVEIRFDSRRAAAMAAIALGASSDAASSAGASAGMFASAAALEEALQRAGVSLAVNEITAPPRAHVAVSVASGAAPPSTVGGAAAQTATIGKDSTIGLVGLVVGAVGATIGLLGVCGCLCVCCRTDEETRARVGEDIGRMSMRALGVGKFRRFRDTKALLKSVKVEMASTAPESPDKREGGAVAQFDVDSVSAVASARV